jgi:hypothetical protein
MHQPGDRLTLISDSDSYADRVLVAIVMEGVAAFVMAIDRAEYDGLAILRLLGVREDPIKPIPNQIPDNIPPKTTARKRS